MERTIETYVHLDSPPEQSSAAVRDDPWAVLTDDVSAEQRRRLQFRMPMEVLVASDAALEHDVLVTVGAISSRAGEVSVALAWAPTEHVRLLPSFDGSLVVRPGRGGGTDVILVGTYRVPLGPVGRFGDTLAGQRLARQSLNRALERFADRLAHAMRRRADATPFRPAAGVPDLRDAPRHDQPSDNYLG